MTRQVHAHRQRDDRGSVAVELAFLFPVIVLLLFAAPQIGLWYFGREAAQHAADSAARAASVTSAQPGTGKAAAEQYLAHLDSQAVSSYTVDETDTVTTITIHIHVEVPKIIPLPGVEPHADITLTRPRERFTTPDSP